MRIRLSAGPGLWFAVLFVFVLAFNLAAKDKAPKMSNVQGRVQMMNKDTSTITVQKGNVQRAVIYSAATKFLAGHSKSSKPGSVDEVKNGNYISCIGDFNAAKLTAKECIYRDAK